MQTQLKQLITQKDALQTKISLLDTQIKSINEGHKFQNGLVDAEGFPRADLDFGQLSNYRNLKRQKAQLNNDHFALMKQIQKKMFQLHKTFADIEPELEEVKPVDNGDKSTTSKTIEQLPKQQIKSQHKIDYLTPFAKLSIVSPNSPAFKAGLQVNDLISQFSQVNIYSVDFMKQIPKYVKQGKPIKIVILRDVQESQTKGQLIFKLKDGKNYQKIAIQIIPAIWQGKGLLGCKIDPLH